LQSYSTSEIYEEILKAETRIRPYTLTTPLLLSRPLSKIIDGKVYLKLENEQHTGSFKARGSLNKILSLTDKEKAQGVVTASTGNHALGFSRALEIAGLEGTVYLPPTASAAKIKALQDYPAVLKYHGNNSLETEIHAKSEAKKEGKIWISPYNDPQIIGGQGTIGIELESQIDHIDHCLVTVGGGGLISGVGSYLKQINPNCKIFGCQPTNSHEMKLSIEAGQIVDMPVELETLSDGSAGGIEPNSITFPLCQSIIDETLLADESAIAEGITFAMNNHKKIIEGAAAVTIATLLKHKSKFAGSNIVLILCGGNIDIKKLIYILSK